MANPENFPVNTPEAVPTETSGEVRQIVNIVLDKAWLIVLCMVVGVLYGSHKIKNTPIYFKATSTVQVEEEATRPMATRADVVQSENLRSAEIVNTIIEKFKSRSLLERVVETNKFTQNPAFVGTAAAGTVTAAELAPRLAGMISVALRKGTRLIDISVASGDPKLAALIANSLVEEYTAQDAQLGSSTIKGAYSYLKEETERLKKKLETSEMALQKYREEAGFVSVEHGQEIVGPQLRELSARLAQARSETARLQRTYDRITQQAKNIADLSLLMVVATNTDVVSVRGAVNKMDQDFKILAQRYKQKHPKYIDAQVQLEAARHELNAAMTNAVNRALESMTVDLENAKYNEEGYQKELRQTESEALKIGQHAIQYSLLLRELEADRAMFGSVLNRMKETSVATEIQPEKLRFIQPALVPSGPIRPDSQRIYTMAILSGLLIGLVLSFGISALDSSFKSIEQAEAYLGLPVLTAIPRLKDVREGDSRFVAAEGSHSRGAEAFRTLRTSLAMLGREEDRRTFLFTSAFPQEGKTFNSINYAITSAQQGLRTLLIDLDLRRPSVEEYITGQKGRLPGVTDYLVGERKFNEIIQVNPSVKHLSWIPAGRVAPNPAELLAQGTFFKLLEEALLHFDRVVIDSAPIHAVSDTLLITSKIQTTVLVVNGKRTPRKPVQRSIQLLKNAGGNPSGIVLNMLPTRRGRGYGYYYDGYYYYHGNYNKDGVYGDKPGKKGEGKKEKPEVTKV